MCETYSASKNLALNNSNSSGNIDMETSFAYMYMFAYNQTDIENVALAHFWTQYMEHLFLFCSDSFVSQSSLGRIEGKLDCQAIRFCEAF